MKIGRFANKSIATNEATAQFARWLSSATDKIILETTVDHLAMRYRVDRRTLECKLLARQDKIRREAASASE